jgi:hypothetical protein
MTIVSPDRKKNIRYQTDDEKIKKNDVYEEVKFIYWRLTRKKSVPLGFHWILDCKYCLVPYPVKNARKKMKGYSIYEEDVLHLKEPFFAVSH